MLVPLHGASLCTVACSDRATVNMLVVAGGVGTRLFRCNNDIINLNSFKLNLHWDYGDNFIFSLFLQQKQHSCSVPVVLRLISSALLATNVVTVAVIASRRTGATIRTHVNLNRYPVFNWLPQEYHDNIKLYSFTLQY